jgi:hypothetical protein
VHKNPSLQLLPPPFLPIVESVSFTSLVAFLNEPKIIFIPSENVELIDKRWGQSRTYG